MSTIAAGTSAVLLVSTAGPKNAQLNPHTNAIPGVVTATKLERKAPS